jgi:uncharacterized protein YjdB
VKDVTGADYAHPAIAWTSSNDAFATVSATGVVTGRSAGTAVISATSGGRSGSATVSVIPVPVASVSVSPPSATLEPAQALTLTAEVRDANDAVVTDRVVTWASSNTAVATVSATGVVTAVAPGTATITATSETQSGSATITVQPAVAYVIVSPGTVFMRRNGTVQLSATAYDAGGNVIIGRAVTWSSNDDRVATVSGTGLVSASHAGTVTITATIGGKTGSAQVTVTN